MNIKLNKNGDVIISGTPEELKQLEYDSNTQKLTNKVILKNEVTLASMSDEIEKWVLEEYRPLFKGKKKGSMGDRHGCVQKLALFRIAYPEYSLEDIMKAAKSYVDSFQEYTYMMQADHFVFKTVLHQGKELLTSKLLTILEDGVETVLPRDMFDSIN
jgi:malonyl CoA-acyl carrier protein transacylase